MTSQPGPRFIIKEDINGIFKNVSIIMGDGFELHLLNRFMYSAYNIPGYEFEIRIDGQEIGTCSLLIESDFNKISEIGNYGVTITSQKHFGEQLPSRVARACYALFKTNGLDSLLTTYEEDNNASACRHLNGG